MPLAAVRGDVPGVDPKTINDLQNRYRLGRRHVMNDLAYVSAQAGKWELTAVRDAEENYLHRDEFMTLGSDAWARCTVMDTFGYVKMVFAAKRTGPVAAGTIEEAQRLFVDARSCAEIELTGAPRRAALATIDSHLRQAADLQRDFR